MTANKIHAGERMFATRGRPAPIDPHDQLERGRAMFRRRRGLVDPAEPIVEPDEPTEPPPAAA
jgi:hypothetical protein